MKFDPLHNFISPVTGRVLCPNEYILLGNKQGIAVPSPILIDIRLELIRLGKILTSLGKIVDSLNKNYDILSQADFVIGHANSQLPNAQILSNLTNGFLFNTGGVVSSVGNIPPSSLTLPFGQVFIGDVTNHAAPSQIISIDNLPNLSRTLTGGNIWRGTLSNRPEESDALTSLELTVSVIQSVTIPSIQADIVVLNGQVLGLLAAVAVIQTQIITIQIDLGNLSRLLQALHLEGFVISTTPSGTDGTMITSRGPTCLLTNIPAGGDVDMGGFRLKNLKQSPVETLDAISAQFLWDLMHDQVGVIWL